MKRRLPMVSLIIIFLISVVDLNHAQPFAAGDAILAESIEQTAHAIGNDSRAFAGEPRWIIANAKKQRRAEQPHQGPTQMSSRTEHRLPVEQRKSREPVRHPKLDPAALFFERKRLFERQYLNMTGKYLVIRSTHRTSPQQAFAMRSLLRRYGVAYVVSLYRSSPAVKEIVRAEKRNRRSGQSIAAMSRVISSQVQRGIFISNHLRWKAMDVRSRGKGRARLSVLRQVARVLDARVSVERDHYHIDL